MGQKNSSRIVEIMKGKKTAQESQIGETPTSFAASSSSVRFEQVITFKEAFIKITAKVLKNERQSRRWQIFPSSR